MSCGRAQLFLEHFLCMSLTISTRGIMQSPMPMAMIYSVKLTEVNPNAPAINGISQTAVVARREMPAAIKRSLFDERSEKILLRWDRILMLWNTSAMDMVRNAMVIPSALSVIAHVPDSIKWPAK